MSVRMARVRDGMCLFEVRVLHCFCLRSEENLLKARLGDELMRILATERVWRAYRNTSDWHVDMRELGCG